MFIHARVSDTILNKADKFFTGTVDGRIIELVQNARRAGAKHIKITHEVVLDKAFIVFEDDGSGIYDFAKLLDLGASGWNREIEDSECPAGIGLFSLAPRCVQIQSEGKSVTIEGDGWVGAEIEVRDDPTMPKGSGTRITFQDEPWIYTQEHSNEKGKPVTELKEHAAYSGVEITFNGKVLPKRSFMMKDAVIDEVLPELGIHVQVYNTDNIPQNKNARCERCYNRGISFNFFGQLLAVDCSDVDHCGGYHFRRFRSGHFLTYPGFCMHIEMTGDASPLRLMLPARTKFVKDAAYKKMTVELERLMYKYIASFPHHDLTYEKWLRAKALGIELPEASPVFQVGTNVGERGNHEPESEPDNYKGLAASVIDHAATFQVWVDDEVVYDNEEERRDSDLEEGILHSVLLEEPTTDDDDVPKKLSVISIPAAFNGYSWVNKPGKLLSVVIKAEKELASEDPGYAALRVYEKLTAEVTAQIVVDGEPRDITYTTDLPCCWTDSDSHIAIAKEALGGRYRNTDLDDLFWLAGGYDEDNSDWDKQNDDFWEAVQRLRDEFVNEHETIRRTLIEKVQEVTGRYSYDKVTVDLRMETVELVHKPYPVVADAPEARELIVVRKDGTFTKTPL